MRGMERDNNHLILIMHVKNINFFLLFLLVNKAMWSRVLSVRFFLVWSKSSVRSFTVRSNFQKQRFDFFRFGLHQKFSVWFGFLGGFGQKISVHILMLDFQKCFVGGVGGAVVKMIIKIGSCVSRPPPHTFNSKNFLKTSAYTQVPYIHTIY